MLSPFDEMKQWIRFGAEDEARLRALWPAVESELVPVTDLFYARILESPGAAAVLLLVLVKEHQPPPESGRIEV